MQVFYICWPMKIKDLPLHLRPREKLITKKAENLKDAELLAILLRTGKAGKNAIEIASSLLQKYELKKLLTLTYEQLISIDGIDSSKACSLLASFELTKRALGKQDNMLPAINSPQDVAFLLQEFTNLKKEYFICLYLNARNQVISKETISIGTIDSSQVHPREVFEPALRNLSVSIILAHNHPSQDPSPSEADINITKKIASSGNILGIEVLDHIIVVKNNYYSLKENDKF